MRATRAFVTLALFLTTWFGWPACAGAVDLADAPVFTDNSVPGNMMFIMSVEYPTGDARAYPDTTDYTANSVYIGYFNPTTCYVYMPAAKSANGTGYFVPYGAATGRACASTSTVHLWSGNFLNWASMSAIDEFRSALTGGYRVVDSESQTILEHAWEDSQANSGDDPKTSISGNSIIAGATPFINWTSLQTSTYHLGNMMGITMSGNPASPSIEYSGQVPKSGTKNCSNNCASTVFWVTVRVEVCDPGVALEGNCTAYKSSTGSIVDYKPEGLIQKNSLNMRYGVESYLNDSDSAREGGVLRARMAYVGPTMPSLSNPGNIVTNPNPEWSGTNGIFIANPDPSDALATQQANPGTTISNSGVINYLNKFGEGAGSGYTGGVHYKSGDNVSELYYAALRYMKYQGNIPQYSADYLPAGDSTSATQMLDGFPDIQTPNSAPSNGSSLNSDPENANDPILYSCQKNFFLGIGDSNTHYDSTLPGSTVSSAGYGQATYSAISADTTVNVTTRTNQVGALEGMGSGIGGKTLPQINSHNCCDTATEYIAGLAFDAHVNDMRPGDFKNASGGKTNIQTLSTYWLDVEEYQRYTHDNQFYLATKYGGFTGSIAPYSGSNSLTLPTLPLTSWHTTNDTQYDKDENITDLQPDNYYDAGQAQSMVAGLTSAFGSIAKQVAASSTAFAVSSPKLTASGNASYGSTYDPANWTGDVDGYSLTFDASGNPTTTQVWSAQAKLDAQSPSSRIIVTCCATSAPVGVPFEASNMQASLASSYATLSEVPGVSAAQESSANFLAWMRGDRTQELGNGGPYRVRSAVLGDITDSKLTVVGAPDAPYSDANNPGYSTFKSTMASRPTVVYVGANDGMMHAFDGSLTDATQGQELFAYIPSAMYGSSTTAPVSGLASLGAPSNFVHHNMVDATPEAFDVDFGRTADATSTAVDWHTVLIGGLGKGGRSYYALDVTNPAAITSEAALASKVLWEFTDSTMGYSYGDPTVVKTAEYGWVVILTSGYNTPDGEGYIYILDPRTGRLLQKISVGDGADGRPSDGLSYGSAYVLDYTDQTADSYYVGDLNGHLWRLDLTPKSGAYAAPTEIAELHDASGNPQPITTRPLIEIDPSSGKRYVMVGTGKLLATSDITTNAQQTFYAIIDGTASNFNTASTLPSGEHFPLGRADLAAVADSVASGGSGYNLATGVGSAPTEPSGWYVDLATSSSGGSSERVTVNPTVNYGVVAFAANTPVGEVCSPSGTNRVFGIDYATAKSILTTSAGSSTIIDASSVLGGLATDLSITNVAGTLHITEGTSLGVLGNVPGNLTSSSSLKQLNWFEMPSAQ